MVKILESSLVIDWSSVWIFAEENVGKLLEKFKPKMCQVSKTSQLVRFQTTEIWR